MTQGGLQQDIVEDIYDEVWTRPSLFRLELRSWRSGLEPPVHGVAHSPFSLSRNVMARPHTDANNDRTTLNIVVPVTRSTAFRRRFLPRNMSLGGHVVHACPEPRQRQLLASCKIR